MRIVKAKFTNSIFPPLSKIYYDIDVVDIIPINDIDDDNEELSFDFVKDHIMGFGYFDLEYLNMHNKVYEYYIDLDFEFSSDSFFMGNSLINKMKIFLRDNRLEKILS